MNLFSSQSKTGIIINLNNSGQSGPTKANYPFNYISLPLLTWDSILAEVQGWGILKIIYFHQFLSLQQVTGDFKNFKNSQNIFSLFQIPSWSLICVSKEKETVFPTLSWILDGLWKDFETLGLWLNPQKAARISHHSCPVGIGPG